MLLAGSSARSGGFARTSAAFFLAGVCAVAATFGISYPGFVGFDAADQFQQAMLGRYIYWHPPLMSAAWRLLLPIAPGQIGMVLLSHTFVYAALAVVLHRLLRSPVAFVLAGVALLSPPIFAPFFTLSKEAFAFASLVLGLFFLAEALGKDGWAQRLPFEAVALVLLVLAAILRFELAPVAGVLIALHVLATLYSGGRWWAALRVARMAVFGVFLACVFAVGVKALDEWISFGVLGAERRYPETTLILHNLAAIRSKRGRI